MVLRNAQYLVPGSAGQPIQALRNFEGLAGAAPSGVDQLSPSLTINGVTETPVFRYKGGDATTSAWPAWGYGDDLAIAGAGSDPVPNAGSPGLGVIDDSIDYQGGKYHEAAAATSGDVTTEDMVIELVFEFDATADTRYISKRAAGVGWMVYSNGTNLIA